VRDERAASNLALVLAALAGLLGLVALLRPYLSGLSGSFGSVAVTLDSSAANSSGSTREVSGFSGSGRPYYRLGDPDFWLHGIVPPGHAPRGSDGRSAPRTARIMAWGAVPIPGPHAGKSALGPYRGRRRRKTTADGWKRRKTFSQVRGRFQVTLRRADAPADWMS
jgi:hypothetical protein